MPLGITQKTPKFYGSVTVGERGQVVIPAKARHELGITPASSLLVFGSPDAEGIALVKVEVLSAYLKSFSSAIQDLEQVIQNDSPEDTGKKK